MKGSTKPARRRCIACGAPFYPDPGHECLLYPPYMMKAVYGEGWETVFVDYNTRWRDAKRRLRDYVPEEDETPEVAEPLQETAQTNDTERAAILGISITEEVPE